MTFKNKIPTAIEAITIATMRRTVMNVFACGTLSSSTYALMPETVVWIFEVEFDEAEVEVELTFVDMSRLISPPKARVTTDELAPSPKMRVAF
jgi:hypothetical protein